MKNIITIGAAIALSAACLFSSCKSEKKEPAPPHLFAEFFVRYLEAEQQVKAHASFFEGDSIGTAMPRAFASGVAFQGSAMESRQLPGGTIRYTIERQASYAESFPFRFQPASGTVREFALSMTPIDTFSVQGGQASKSKGMALSAPGGRLEKNESMVLLFSDEHNRASTINLQGPSPGDTYRIPAAKIEPLTLGTNKLYLVKKKRLVERSDTLSILADMEYYTGTLEVEVVE